MHCRENFSNQGHSCRRRAGSQTFTSIRRPMLKKCGKSPANAVILRALPFPLLFPYMISRDSIRQLLLRLESLGVAREDLVETFVRGRGNGGQKINKTSS